MLQKWIIGLVGCVFLYFLNVTVASAEKKQSPLCPSQNSGEEATFIVVDRVMNGSFPSTTSITEYSFIGPVGRKMLIGGLLTDVTRTPCKTTYYGVASQDVFSITSKGTLEPLILSSRLPKLSWTTGIAFDARRNRVIISTLGGEGYLYAYRPQTHRWSLVASLKNIDLGAIAYLPKYDRIYGVGHTLTSDPNSIVFYYYTPTGRLVDRLSLGISLAHSTIHSFQLVPYGDRLVFLYDGDASPDSGISPEQCLVIDPRASTAQKCLLKREEKNGRAY